MAGSRIVENLDSLWFFTNILTCNDETDEVPSLKHQLEASIESPKRDECESPKKVLCHKCGEEVGLVKGDSEVVRKSEKKKEKKERKMKRKQKNEAEAEAIFGGLGSEFYVDANGFLSATQMPPMDDVVAMKQHLKSWAYTVACIVK